MTQQKITETDNKDLMDDFPSFEINHGDDLRIFYNAQGLIAIVCDDSQNAVCIHSSDVNRVCKALVALKKAIEECQ